MNRHDCVSIANCSYNAMQQLEAALASTASLYDTEVDDDIIVAEQTLRARNDLAAMLVLRIGSEEGDPIRMEGRDWTGLERGTRLQKQSFDEAKEFAHDDELTKKFKDAWMGTVATAEERKL